MTMASDTGKHRQHSTEQLTNWSFNARDNRHPVVSKDDQCKEWI